MAHSLEDTPLDSRPVLLQISSERFVEDLQYYFILTLIAEGKLAATLGNKVFTVSCKGFHRQAVMIKYNPQAAACDEIDSMVDIAEIGLVKFVFRTRTDIGMEVSRSRQDTQLRKTAVQRPYYSVPRLLARL